MALSLFLEKRTSPPLFPAPSYRNMALNLYDGPDFWHIDNFWGTVVRKMG